MAAMTTVSAAFTAAKGAPRAVARSAKAPAGALGVRTMHVSLTHTADLAAAVVIAEG